MSFYITDISKNSAWYSVRKHILNRRLPEDLKIEHVSHVCHACKEVTLALPGKGLLLRNPSNEALHFISACTITWEDY